jgi:peptidoglycan/LPS O-acetylase OafA/YrhL
MIMGKAERPESGMGGTLAVGYRPWLDGLRAVAVVMVVIQHTLGAMPLDLGFVGVGLFFGLSGYLITSLLLDERAARGGVSLSTFYLRRAARLFPALVLVLVVCDAVFMLQGDLAPLKDSIPAITYTANYVEIVESRWLNAYGPTWSLAVEEHFYILWPLVLLSVTGRFGLRTALKMTLALCLVSLTWRAVLAVMNARYFLLAIGSVERADALLYGCAAAIALRLGWRPRTWMLWIGIAAVGVSPIVFNHESYPTLVIGSAVVAIAAAAVVAGMDYVAPLWLRRCLSLRPIVVVGVLSYGIYLWHQPMMRIVQNFAHESPSYRAIAVLIAVLLAGLSHRFIEVPVRSWVRRRTRGARVAAPRRSLEVVPHSPKGG